MVLVFILTAIGGAAGWDHWILFVEAAIIALFAAYWIVQTFSGDPQGA